MSVRSLLMAAAGASTSAPAYRYWRIYFQAVVGSDRVYIAEIELRGSVGGSDLTTPSTPATASTYEFGYGPEKAIDNNIYSPFFWVTPYDVTTNQWACFDMASAVVVAQVAIMPAVNACPKDFIIQGSSDGVNFTDVKAFTNVTGWTNNTWKTFDL